MYEFVFDKLGICGCGSEDAQVEFIKNYLNYINEYGYMNNRVIDLIRTNPDIVFEILNHFLVNRGLLTYGRSVRGAWFDDTEENVEFLRQLNNLGDEDEGITLKVFINNTKGEEDNGNN